MNVPLISKSVPVVAKTRKLKASWTREMAQDLNIQYDGSLNIKKQMDKFLTEWDDDKHRSDVSKSIWYGKY